MKLQPATWDEVAYLPDSAVAALGDPRLLDDTTWIQQSLPCAHARRSGYGMIDGLAETDGLAIEIARIGARRVGARMEFTTDVGELERNGDGRWTVVGRARIGTGGAVALDTKQRRVDGWCDRMPLPEGFYAAEAFVTDDDHLGIRLIAGGAS